MFCLFVGLVARGSPFFKRSPQVRPVLEALDKPGFSSRLPVDTGLNSRTGERSRSWTDTPFSRLVSSRLVCLARPKHPKKIEIPYRIPRREINGQREKGFECGLTTRVGDGMRQIPGARAWRKGPLVDEGLRNALQKQKPPNSPLSFDDSGSSKKARHHLVFFKPVNLKATHFVRASKRCHPGKQPYTVQN